MQSSVTKVRLLGVGDAATTPSLAKVRIELVDDLKKMHEIRLHGFVLIGTNALRTSLQPHLRSGSELHSVRCADPTIVYIPVLTKTLAFTAASEHS